MMFENWIEQVKTGRDLTEQEMEQAIGSMLGGQATNEEMGRLLLALREKGGAVSELVGPLARCGRR